MLDIIRAGLRMISVLLAIVLFFTFAPSIIQPITDMAQDDDAVQDSQVKGLADEYERATLQHGPTLLGGGVIFLTIFYAVFRERIRGALGGGRRGGRY